MRTLICCLVVCFIFIGSSQKKKKRKGLIYTLEKHDKNDSLIDTLYVTKFNSSQKLSITKHNKLILTRDSIGNFTYLDSIEFKDTSMMIFLYMHKKLFSPSSTYFRYGKPHYRFPCPGMRKTKCPGYYGSNDTLWGSNFSIQHEIYENFIFHMIIRKQGINSNGYRSVTSFRYVKVKRF